MFRCTRVTALGGLFTLVLSTTWAQSPEEVGPDVETVGTTAPAVPSDQSAEAGPKAFLADIDGKLGTLDLGNGAVNVIGSTGKFMTDIAFCPGGTLYGIFNFNKLYRINTSNAQKTLIGNTTVTLNALVCSSAGKLLAMGPNSTNLFQVNRNTGKATSIGNTTFRSAGDLAFHEGKLYLTSTTRRLVNLNPANGAPQGSVAHNITDLWGLVSAGTNKLYGFAFNRAYLFTENAQGPTGATIQVSNFANKGLAKTAGASLNGPF